jgi:hypothetical protein
MSASGNQAEPLYMIADDNMSEDEFRVYPVNGLGVGTQLDNKGYVVITKTRCANVPFYRWFVETILVKYVQEMRRVYEIPLDSPAWFQLDGEAVQIDPFKTNAMIKLLSDNNIHVGKPPGSTTAITQPCDAGNCFKGPKTSNKYIKDHDVKHMKWMLERLSNIVFKPHNEWLNSEARTPLQKLKGKAKKRLTKKDKTDAIEMSPSHVQLAKLGLLRVRLALQKSMRPHMITVSFLITGIYPFSLPVILNNWKSKLSLEESTLVGNSLEALTDLFEEQGELFDADLIATGIQSHVVRGGKKAMDLLVLNRRRSCMLTSPALIARERVKNPVPEDVIEVAVPIQLEPVGRKRRASNEPEARAAMLRRKFLN